MIVLNGQMPIATGTENDDRIRSFQNLRGLGPASRLNHHMHAGSALQAVLDQHATGLVLVLQNSMTGRSGNEYDFFVIRLKAG
jgi:hypothetical protein